MLFGQNLQNLEKSQTTSPQKNHFAINDFVKLSALIETPIPDGSHRQPLQAPKNDFAKPFHFPGAHRDAATAPRLAR
jgi:hypothetical protein